MRRKRKGGGVTQPQSATPLNPAAPAPVSPTTDPEAKTRQQPADAFKVVFEKAADMVKGEVASTGKVRPTAIFVYENEAGTAEASTTKTVILDWRDELQKEARIGRIREKALTERASAVLTLTEAGPESRSRPRGRGMLMLSGVAPGVHFSARVDYVFAAETKSITSWELRYLDKPVLNVFLDGIFPMERRPV
jgi:hypothetical protein